MGIAEVPEFDSSCSGFRSKMLICRISLEPISCARCIGRHGMKGSHGDLFRDLSAHLFVAHY